MSSWFFWLYGILLLIGWIYAGGLVSNASVKLGPYKNKDGNLHNAYWLTFWAAFVTWTLVGLFIIGIILSIVGVVALFSTGIGEAGVAGGAAAEGAAVAAEEGAVLAEEAGTVAEEELETTIKNKAKDYAKDYTKKQARSKMSWLTIGFLILALSLVITTGILAAIAASDINKSDYFKQNQDNSKLQKAYRDCVIAAYVCLVASGVLIVGFILYQIIEAEKRRRIQKQIEKEEEEKIKEEQERQRKLREIRQAELQVKVQKEQQRKSELDARRKEREQFQLQLAQAQQQATLLKVYQQAGVAPGSIPGSTPLNVPISSLVSTANPQQCYINLGLDSNAEKSEVTAMYDKLLDEYHPDKCKDPCCGPNFRIIKDSKDKIMGDNTQSGCSPLLPCSQ